MIITMSVNGETRSAEVDGWESLLWVLRERWGVRGPKPACEQGECGACSVILDGEVVCSCLVMSGSVDGSDVTTAEGLGDPEHLHPIQQAFIDHGAVQCGYCTPGLLVAAAHLLETEPHPTSEEVREALSGNLCRCTGYGAVLRAVLEAANEAQP